MIGYATFGTKDKETSVRFFEAVLAPLGYQKFYDDHVAGFAIDGNPGNGGTVWVGPPFDGNEAQASNGAMIGFVAPSRGGCRCLPCGRPGQWRLVRGIARPARSLWPRFLPGLYPRPDRQQDVGGAQGR